MTEQELIRELKSGSNKAFDSIYTMYFKRLYAYCLQFTKNSEDAEEIVEDVFVRLWKIKETIRQEDTLRSLLFIMSKHYLINSFHSNINSPKFESYVDYKEHLSSDNVTHNLEYEDFLKKLRKELDKLPDTQRKVVELSRLQQLTNKEIAAKLQLSEQTVKNQLSLGIKSLRSTLGCSLLFVFFIINN
jgi:RNA polymerase sigma-70 factor (family 1)